MPFSTVAPPISYRGVPQTDGHVGAPVEQNERDKKLWNRTGFQSVSAGFFGFLMVWFIAGSLPCKAPASTPCTPTSKIVSASLPGDEICPVRVKQGWTFYKPRNDTSVNWVDDHKSNTSCLHPDVSTFGHKDKMNLDFAATQYLKLQPGAPPNGLRFFIFNVRLLQPFLNIPNPPFVNVYWRFPELTPGVTQDWYYKRDSYVVNGGLGTDPRLFSSFAMAVSDGNHFDKVKDGSNWGSSDDWGGNDDEYVSFFKLTKSSLSEYGKKSKKVTNETGLQIFKLTIGTDTLSYAYHFSVEKVSYQLTLDERPTTVEFAST
jgi:hypothetical protein